MAKSLVPSPTASDTYKVTIVASAATTTLTIVDFITVVGVDATKAALVYTATNKELFDTLLADSFTVSSFTCVAG